MEQLSAVDTGGLNIVQLLNRMGGNLPAFMSNPAMDQPGTLRWQAKCGALSSFMLARPHLFLRGSGGDIELESGEALNA